MANCFIQFPSHTGLSYNPNLWFTCNFAFSFLEIEPVTDPSLPSVPFIGNGRTLQMNTVPVEDKKVNLMMLSQSNVVTTGG